MKTTKRKSSWEAEVQYKQILCNLKLSSSTLVTMEMLPFCLDFFFFKYQITPFHGG